MRRVWLVFRGVDEVTIPLRGTRLPTGIWLTSPFGAEDAEGEFRSFTCRALLPTFDGNVLRPAGTPGEISLLAQELVGVVSTRAETPTDYGLTWEEPDRPGDGPGHVGHRQRPVNGSGGRVRAP